jgi:hypothetical protein
MTMPGGLIGRALGAFGGQLPGRPMMNPAAAPGAGMAAAPGGSTITHTMQQMMPGAGMAPRGGTVPLRPPSMMGLLGQAFSGVGAPGGAAGGLRPVTPPPIAHEGPGMMGQGAPMAGGAPTGNLGAILARLFPGQGNGVADGFKGQGGPFAAAGAAPTPPAAAAPPSPATPKPGMAPGARPLPRGMSVNGRRTY